jgi:hypothetical protein
MSSIANNNDTVRKFKRLFVLMSVFIGIILIAISTALYQDPKGFFPFFSFIFPFLLLMFTYFYMMCYLGKQGYLDYTASMFLGYFKIPSMFYDKTVNSRQGIYVFIFIASFVALLMSIAWIEWRTS